MTSLDEPEQPEETLYEPQIQLGGMLDVFNSKFPDHKETLEMVNSIRRQIIDDPFAEIKLPANCDAAYFGSPVLLDLDIKLANPHLNVYQWIRNILTLKFYLRKNTLPMHTLKTLYLNLGEYEICDTYEYDCNSVEIYETSIDLNAKYKYLLDRYNDASALTKTAVKNGHINVFKLLNVRYDYGAFQLAIIYNQVKAFIALHYLCPSIPLICYSDITDITRTQNPEMLEYAMSNKMVNGTDIAMNMDDAIRDRNLNMIKFLSKYVTKIPNAYTTQEKVINLLTADGIGVLSQLDLSNVDMNVKIICAILCTKNTQIIRMFVPYIHPSILWNGMVTPGLDVISCFEDHKEFIDVLISHQDSTDKAIIAHYKDRIRDYVSANVSKPILKALIRKTDLETFKYVIPTDCDLTKYPGLLSDAICAPNFEIFEYLVSMGLDINFSDSIVPNDSKGEPMAIAIECKDSRFKELLLSKNVELMNRRVILAAAKSNPELFKIIIRKGLSEDHMSMGLIGSIIYYNKSDDIKQFVKLGMPVTNQLLVGSIEKNDPDLMQFLIDHGATMDDDCDYDEISEFITESDATKSLEFAIKHNFEMQIDEENILAAGLKYGSVLLVEYALYRIYKNDINYHFCDIKCVDHLKLFLEHEADVHAGDDHYITDIVEHKNIEVLTYLLENFMFPKGLLRKLHTTTDCQKIKELIKPFIQEP